MTVKYGLVDEVEVYRIFGGCLPAESTAANSIYKTLGQPNAQRDGDAKFIRGNAASIFNFEIRGQAAPV